MTAPAAPPRRPVRAGRHTESRVRRIRLPQKLRNMRAVAAHLRVHHQRLGDRARAARRDGTRRHAARCCSAPACRRSSSALHIALRFVARDADPFVLPIATVLNGLGIAMIYRIDIADGDSGWESASVRQIAWTRDRDRGGHRDHPRDPQPPRAVPLHATSSGLLAIVLLLLPLVPGHRRARSAARDVWIAHRRRSSFQPGELAKIALAIFFAGYLVRNARLAVDGRAHVPRHAVPAGARPRTAARRLGALDGGHRVPARPRHRACSTSACSS